VCALFRVLVLASHGGLEASYKQRIVRACNNDFHGAFLDVFVGFEVFSDTDFGESFESRCELRNFLIVVIFVVCVFGGGLW